MKNIIPLLLLSIILIGCIQEVKRYHIDEVISPNDTLMFLKEDMSLLNGSVYCEFGEMGTFINGGKYGLHREYWSNGQLRLEETYKDTKLKLGYDSLDTRHKVREGTFIETNTDPSWKFIYWYPYDLRLIGTQKYWYENGQLESEKEVKDGFNDGRSREWYKNGKCIGNSRGWKEDGQLKYETKYEILDGWEEQIWFKSYDSNGNFTIDYIYKDTTQYIEKDGKMIPIN